MVAMFSEVPNRNRIKKIENKLIPCFCGCGTLIPERDEKGRPRKYVFGHTNRGRKFSESFRQKLAQLKKGNQNRLGKKHSDETKKKISDKKTGVLFGEKHHFFKEENVGMTSLHRYVRRRLPVPEFCIICNKVPPTDLANITGIYERDLKNWGYMCHKCHLYFDNIIERNLTFNKKS